MMLHDPRALASLLSPMGEGAAADISINPGFALIFGYFADSVLDWLVSKVPILQKEMPAVNGKGTTAR
jgi:hypothetical protein